jgi:flagellar biosynthetic protein FliR
MIDTDTLNQLVAAAPAFLLVAVRALALIESAPLLSSPSVPQIAKVALAGFAAFCAYPDAIKAQGWSAIDPGAITFVFMLAGEALIGLLTGFYLNLIFTVFSTTGQFIGFQMGFSMAESFDPTSQVTNPLLGQYLDLVANLVFLTIGGFTTLFLGGFQRSFQTISIAGLIAGREAGIMLILKGLSQLFLDAAIISMPVMGTLFLITLATGLISKAAPQINILSEGFPISIMAAFILLLVSMPYMVEAFVRVLNAAFQALQNLMTTLAPSLTASTSAIGGAV